MQTDALSEDIEAINRQFLNLVARHSELNEELCLRLNISRDFLAKISSISSGNLDKVASLGTFLLQPLVDGETLHRALKLQREQGQALLRSAARFKPGLGR